MRNVTLLGATGSIGTSTLDVLRRHKDEFKLHAVAASSSVDKMVAIVQEFKPERVAMHNEKSAQELSKRLKDSGLYAEVLAGAQGVEDVAGDGVADVVVGAIVGAAGLTSYCSCENRLCNCLSKQGSFGHVRPDLL